MRTVIKNTLCSLLFLGILIGMLALLSVLFRPKENTKEAGFQDPPGERRAQRAKGYH